jgi:cell wall-associated NlpC family hydrolase
LFPNCFIWIVCCVMITMPSSPVSGIEMHSSVPFSSVNITREPFKYKVKEYLGIPYRRGGTSKKGMDCSNFVRIVYKRLFNIELPFSVRNQFRSSRLQKINEYEMQSGDLVFFSNTKKKRINHVGMYVSGGQFIHASSSSGIMFSRLDDPYWKNRFVGSKRHMILNSKAEF